MPIITGSDITRPATTPLSSSVLDHATVVENANEFGLRNDEGLWISYNCMDTLFPTSICPDPLASKEFGFAAWQPGLTFALYGGVQCKAVGLDAADQKAEIARVFSLNEGKGIEQVLMFNRFVAADSSNDPLWDAPEDLTPSGKDIPLAVALALLEGYAADKYAGVPTIHMPRAAASLLADRIVWEGGRAYTLSGAKVAVGGGYDDGAGRASGKWSMYATGEVYVERSGLVNLNAWVLPGQVDTDGGSSSEDEPITDNNVLAIAERMYRVAVDCFVAEAEGTVWK